MDLANDGLFRPLDSAVRCRLKKGECGRNAICSKSNWKAEVIMDWRDQIDKWLGEWCQCEGRWRCYWHELFDGQGYCSAVFQEMLEEDERRTVEKGGGVGSYAAVL